MLIARQAFRGKADSEAGLSQAGEPDEEEDGAEQSDAVPNGDDTSFEDLMEYIILQVNNPKGEEEGDASVVYNIRIEAVRELLDASTIKDWTNGQVVPYPCALNSKVLRTMSLVLVHQTMNRARRERSQISDNTSTMNRAR